MEERMFKSVFCRKCERSYEEGEYGDYVWCPYCRIKLERIVDIVKDAKGQKLWVRLAPQGCEGNNGSD